MEPKIIVKGKSPSRKISDNLTVILGLIQQDLLVFGDQFIALDCHNAESVNDMVCHTDGKVMVIHGTIHIKLLSNGQIVGRFDPDKEER